MTTTSCPAWAQDCYDCGQSIPGGTWRQYVDDTSLAVRHVNGCPDIDDLPQCPHCEQRYDLTGGCDGDKPECHAITT